MVDKPTQSKYGSPLWNMGILISLARVSVQPQQPHKASFQNLLKFPSRSTREAVRISDSAPSSDKPEKHQLAKGIPVHPATVDSPLKADYATELFYMLSMDGPKNGNEAIEILGLKTCLLRHGRAQL
ncbi:unnamed protein product [Rhodiola kirilowii]